MKISHYNDYESLSRQAASMVRDEVETNTKLLLCAPTGSSPAGLYRELAELSKQGKTDFRQIRIIKLDKQGPIDLCILGLGTNGHLGLNEPGPFLEPYCHRAELSQESLQHEMIRSLEPKPGFGLTLGMMEILSSGKLILLLSGKNEEEVISKLLSKKISSKLPASLLWLHRDVECLINTSSLG